MIVWTSRWISDSRDLLLRLARLADDPEVGIGDCAPQSTSRLGYEKAQIVPALYKPKKNGVSLLSSIHGIIWNRLWILRGFGDPTSHHWKLSRIRYSRSCTIEPLDVSSLPF